MKRRANDIARRVEALEARAGVGVDPLLSDPVAWLESAASKAMRASIVLDEWQCQAMRDDSRELLMLCSRQVGKSFTVAGKSAHKVAASPGETWLIISPTQRQSNRLFRMARSFLVASGARISESRVSDLVLENEAELIALPGNQPDACRGYTAHGVVIDEAAFVKDEVPAVVFPTLSTTGGQSIMLSTPGLPRGEFYRAVKAEGAEPYMIRATDCGRITPEFLAKERRRLGPARFATEFELQFREVPGSLFSGTDIERLFGRAVENETDPRDAMERELAEALKGDEQAATIRPAKLPARRPRLRVAGTGLAERTA